MNRAIPRALALFFSGSMLSGCVVNTYYGDKAPEEISTVSGETRQVGNQRYSTRFVSYAVVNGIDVSEFKRFTSFWIGPPSKLRFVPGQYMLMVDCFTNRGMALLKLQVTVNAGTDYLVHCEPALDKINTVQAGYDAVVAK